MIPRQLGMQGNAAMYSNANVWMQTFHCCCTGMLRQLPTDLSAQQSLLSSLYRQLPSEAQQACEGAEQGITLDELQAAVKLSARGKKPGSDGLPYEFFSQFWEVLGPELLAVLQDAFQAQHGLFLPTSMTQGVITLLYKGKGSKALLDKDRPITHLNSDFELLAKVLATRFGPALQHVVDPTQNRFCAWSVDWRSRVVPCRGGRVPAANRSAWLHGFYGFQQGI